MGVRGLSTYISQNSDYFIPFELHNTYLVIDAENYINNSYRGSNLARHYGGEYLDFTICARIFLKQLRRCRITPIFVFDGCHGKHGLKRETLLKRNRERISDLRSLLIRSHHEGDADSLTSVPDILPKLTNSVFVDILKETGTYHVSCEREADVHIAELACFLNSPFVSNDSDFYIFRPPTTDYNYQYIPLNTLSQQPIRSCERVCSNCPSGCYVLPCLLFRPYASLLGHIYPPLLPLLAALIGNDFISAVRVPNTVDPLMQKPSRPGLSYTGKRIDALIRWLGSFGTDVIEPLLQILSQYQESELQSTAQHMIEIILDYAVHPSATGRELASVLKLTRTTSSKSSDLAVTGTNAHAGASLRPVLPLPTTTTTNHSESELLRIAHTIVEALPMSGYDRFVRPTEDKLTFRWPEPLTQRLHQVELPTGVMDTLYVTGGSVQRILFEDLLEQRASIYTVINPMRRVFYNLLIGLELDRDCAYKLSGLCDGRDMVVTEHRRQSDQMCPFAISVYPQPGMKPVSSFASVTVNMIRLFHEQLGLDLDRPAGLASDLRTIRAVLILWFRFSPSACPERQSSITCSSVALAFVACALATHAHLAPCLNQHTLSVDRAASQLCESFTILANSVKRDCRDLRYSIRLVHQINELQLLVLELKYLWHVLNCLFELDSKSHAPVAPDNDENGDDASVRLSFWPNWMLFPSGRLIYWLAHRLAQMRPEFRLEVVLNTWLPRLHEAGSYASMGASCDLGALRQRVRLLCDSLNS